MHASHYFVAASTGLFKRRVRLLLIVAAELRKIWDHRICEKQINLKCLFMSVCVAQSAIL